MDYLLNKFDIIWEIPESKDEIINNISITIETISF